MSFTESKILKQITVLPEAKSINVQWSNQVKKGDAVISETFECTSFTVDSLNGFTSNGITIDLNAFLAAFNAAALDEKAAAITAKATAEAALAAKDATIASLQAQIDAYTPPAPTAPSTTVTARQIRLALTQVGLRDAVEAAVAASDQATKDWYEYANDFERNNAMVIGMAAALGVSDEDLDNLFALAATL